MQGAQTPEGSYGTPHGLMVVVVVVVVVVRGSGSCLMHGSSWRIGDGSNQPARPPSFLCRVGFGVTLSLVSLRSSRSACESLWS